MTVEKLELKSNPGATLTAYLLDTSKEMPNMTERPAVLVIPGGGYSFLAAREGEPIAIGFLQAGYQVCILRYSVRAQEGEPFLDNLPLRQAGTCASASAMSIRRCRISTRTGSGGDSNTSWRIPCADVWGAPASGRSPRRRTWCRASGTAVLT